MKPPRTRMPKRLFIGVSVVVCLIGCATQPEQPARSEQPGDQLQYIEILTGGAKAEDTLPMVAVVHGLGDRPESFTPFMDVLGEKARVILPRAPTPWGGGYAWFDQSQDGNWDNLSSGMERSAKRIADLLSHLTKTKPTRGRPILAGFSQGGMLSFAVAANHPQTISLAVPISGLLPIPLWPKEIGDRISYPQVRALHGTADRIVPITHARDTVAHLRKIGLDVTLVEYPGVSHTISRAMRRQVVDLIGQEIRKQR